MTTAWLYQSQWRIMRGKIHSSHGGQEAAWKIAVKDRDGRRARASRVLDSRFSPAARLAVAMNGEVLPQGLIQPSLRAKRSNPE